MPVNPRTPLILTVLTVVLFFAWLPGTAVALQDPAMTEAQAKDIASRHGGIPLVISDHPELEIHASFSSERRMWTINWRNPANGRVMAEVEISDNDGRVISSSIEDEAYFDVLPMMHEEEVVSLAESQKDVQDWLQDKEDIRTSADLGDDGVWTVSFKSGADTQAEVLVDDSSGQVDETRTGPQVAWSMARGYKGAFGRIVNEPYIWLPLCFLFLAPFIRIRRPLRLLHLDLLVLLSFTISHYFFNQGEIFTSVPLAYPPLAYLFIRLAWMGLGRRRHSEGAGSMHEDELPPGLNFSSRVIFIGLILLVVFRVAINIADSNVVDVGYSGVIGAQRIQEGVTPYGNMTDDNSNGDTYGPLNYLLYVPFEKVLPWSGEWDSLYAAHAAAIIFDLAAIAGMYFAGRQLAGKGRKGNLLGLALAYGWAAYPYTAFVMSSNVNDTIVAAFIIWGFVFMRAVPLAAVFLGFATQIKFFPAILGPLWSSFPRAYRGWGKRAFFILAFAAALAAPIPIIFLGDGSLALFWERSLRWQLGRDSPFSIWGQHPDTLAQAQRIAQYILLGLSVGSYFWPPKKSLYRLAAATAALIIGFQLVQTHWFYLYIPWFFPFALIAFLVRAGRIREDARGEYIQTNIG